MIYNFSKAIGKLKYLLIGILPIIIDMFIKAYPDLAGLSVSEIIDYLLNLIYPNLGGLTIGGILILVVNFLKFRKDELGRREGGANNG